MGSKVATGRYFCYSLYLINISFTAQLDNVTAHKYLHAAIGVGSVTVVCLVAVPVIVTAVWCRRRLHVNLVYTSITIQSLILLGIILGP